jgi:hypothetical protein
MAGEVRRIAFVPRFATISNSGSSTLDVFFDPVPVREFHRGDLTAWLVGSGTTLTLQEGVDLQTWSDRATLSADSTQPVTALNPVDTEWMRVKASVTAGNKATFWVVGDFTVRGT